MVELGLRKRDRVRARVGALITVRVTRTRPWEKVSFFQVFVEVRLQLPHQAFLRVVTGLVSE